MTGKMQANKIARSSKTTHCYISKRGAYYRENSSGYTEHLHEAGVYTKQEALDAFSRCDELWLIPVNVTYHNEMIIEKTNKLLSKYIHAKE